MLQRVGLPSLADGGLLKTDAYIDGAWRAAQSAARFPVSNPADGLKLADVANCVAFGTAFQAGKMCSNVL